MKYSTLGKTGLDISAVGIGTWQFDGEWGKEFVQDEVNQIMYTAKEEGINFLIQPSVTEIIFLNLFLGTFLNRINRKTGLWRQNSLIISMKILNEQDIGMQMTLNAVGWFIKSLEINYIEIY